MPYFSSFWKKHYPTIKSCCTFYPLQDNAVHEPEFHRFIDFIDTAWMMNEELKWVGWDLEGWYIWIDPDGLVYRFAALVRNGAGKKQEARYGKLRLNNDGSQSNVPVPAGAANRSKYFYEWELEQLSHCGFCPSGSTDGVENKGGMASTPEEKDEQEKQVIPNWQQYVVGDPGITDVWYGPGNIPGAPPTDQIPPGIMPTMPPDNGVTDKGGVVDSPAVPNTSREFFPPIFRTPPDHGYTPYQSAPDPDYVDDKEDDCFPKDAFDPEDAPEELRPYLNKIKNVARYQEIRNKIGPDARVLFKIVYYSGGKRRHATIVLQPTSQNGKTYQISTLLKNIGIGPGFSGDYHGGTVLEYKELDCSGKGIRKESIDQIPILPPVGLALPPTTKINIEKEIKHIKFAPINGDVIFPKGKVSLSASGLTAVIPSIQKLVIALNENPSLTLEITGGVSVDDAKENRPHHIDDNLSYVDPKGNTKVSSIKTIMLERAEYLKKLIKSVADDLKITLKNIIRTKKDSGPYTKKGNRRATWQIR